MFLLKLSILLRRPAALLPRKTILFSFLVFDCFLPLLIGFFLDCFETEGNPPPCTENPEIFYFVHGNIDTWRCFYICLGIYSREIVHEGIYRFLGIYKKNCSNTCKSHLSIVPDLSKFGIGLGLTEYFPLDIGLDLTECFPQKRFYVCKSYASLSFPL